LTLVTQICLSDLWCQWGYPPDVVVGHSTGELAAAFQAGFYTLEEVLLLAYRIGQAASHLDGVMAHGRLSEPRQSGLTVNLSSYNFRVGDTSHVTLSGYPEEMNNFLGHHRDFVKMRLPHPWHHPDYRQFSDSLAFHDSMEIPEGVFVSGVTTGFETRLSSDHWSRWLVQPIDFIQSMQTLNERYGTEHLVIIEIGFHPVLEKCCEIFHDASYVSSMYRGEDDIGWILSQRRLLPEEQFLQKVKHAVDTFKPGLDFGVSLAYQGLGSLEFTELSVLLQSLFPTLSPQDFYRYKTVNQLIEGFGIQKQVQPPETDSRRKNRVVIAAMSCRFPSSVETPAQFWDNLLSGQDQVRQVPGRGAAEAGFLNDSVSRFDHRYFGIPPAEARVMDPQQILALELTEMLWRDAGIDPETLDKQRVGVYLGVWNQEYGGDRASVFYPTGTNPSIIASRISYHYDLRGPSWVSNTACSSSLVAVHYAAKDIEAGRVDYAVAGGVNMLLDERFTSNMENSGFLSRDNRCKTFDDAADGYVRAEGGGLVLLVNASLADRYYAEISGSAINQNGRRAQVITAPHPEAQEELISAACQEAGIRPTDIAYVECHGTGTKIGDPIEISALQRTVAHNRKTICYIGSVKSNLGHLESAAGIAGLIKSTAILVQGVIPPNLHFRQPNTYIDFNAHHLQVVTENAGIDREAYIGISSFGFGGSNAHIIIKGADASLRKAIRPLEIPFDRQRALSLGPYIRLDESAKPSTETEGGLDPDGTDVSQAPDNRAEASSPAAPETGMVTREIVDRIVGEILFQLTSIEEIDPQVELIDQGLDSLSGTELIAQLEAALKIEIGPDILLEYPLRDQFVDEVYAMAAHLRN